jgi:hypothetical protein
MKHPCVFFTTAAVCGFLAICPAQSQIARRRNPNLNVNLQGDADTCSALRASSREGEIAQANEAFTLSKGEAPMLEMSSIDRGIFRVRGWDRPDYSVEACKVAVGETRAAAEQALRGISITRSAGRFSSSGPSSSDSNWEVYFIVHTPKDANLSLETKNGPISIENVTGTLKVRSTSGPVSLRDASGILDVHTTNGPISFSGGGGEAHLIAQNGPISLDLTGDVWNGSQLEARTMNGPVSLAMAETFHSGVRLETDGHGPISCAISACQNAWTNTASDQRVIQFNGSQDTVRVSTSNGPVSIHASRKDKRII